MAPRYEARSTTQVFEALSAAATRREIPLLVVEEARAATARALELDATATCTTNGRRRIEAYFWAVVRRRVLKGGVAPRAAARLLAASVVADMRSAGRDGSDIWHELERGWSDRLPVDVLEEFRVRLCA